MLYEMYFDERKTDPVKLVCEVIEDDPIRPKVKVVKDNRTPNKIFVGVIYDWEKTLLKPLGRILNV